MVGIAHPTFQSWKKHVHRIPLHEMQQIIADRRRDGGQAREMPGVRRGAFDSRRVDHQFSVRLQRGRILSAASQWTSRRQPLRRRIATAIWLSARHRKSLSIAQSFLPSAPNSRRTRRIAPTIIDFNDIISRTWTMLKENYVVVLLGWFVPAIIGNIVNYGLSFGGVIIGNVVFRSQNIAQILNFAGSFFGIFFSCWLFLGQSIYMLKVARGQDAQLSDVFSGGRFYLTGLMAMILWFLAYIGGILLLIVPGVIWGLMFSQCYFFVIDRNADATASLSLSKQFMQGNKATVFLIWLVCGMGGGVIVLCTCFIGAFAVYPFLSLLNAVIYLGVTGQPTAYQYRSAPPM